MHKSSFKDNDNYPKEQIRENSKVILDIWNPNIFTNKNTAYF
jgi:hypothetical protein